MENRMKMDAAAWRSEVDKEYIYVLQVNNIKHGDKTTLTKLFSDWRVSAHGWNIKENTQLMILKRQFSSEKHWKEWAKSCPIKVIEYKYRAGKSKLIQHSCKTRKKRVSKNG